MEEWKDIKDYEGLYQVSSEGNVRNKHGKVIAKELFKGYLRVHLWKNGKSKHHFIHRLVAEAFIPNPDNKATVNHKNENKTSNEVWNIEWMTHGENTNYGTRNERCSNKQRNDINKSKPIFVYSFKTGEKMFYFPSIQEAKRVLGVGNVQKVINGIYKQEKGYTFKYA